MLIHPINFKKKHKSKLWILILAVLVLISLYLLNKSPEITKIVQETITSTISTPFPFTDAPSSYELPTSAWVPQTFNNCGPAAASMALQHFGFNVSQEETKAHLRTNPDDKNVFMSEISAYIKKDYNVQNKVIFNGDLKTLKTLVANGIYVVVEDWLHPYEDIGHVLVVRGYDDAEGVLIADDSYFGVGIKYPYSTWEETQWKPYNREFMPVYKSEDEDLVKAIVGDNWDENKMYQGSVATNLKDVNANPDDMYAWFNLGISYYHLGQYTKAKDAFEKSQSIGWPQRLLWYFIEPVQTYNKLNNYQKAIDTANLGLWANDNFAEMHYEKAVAYKGLGKVEESKKEIQKTLELDSNFTLAKGFY